MNSRDNCFDVPALSEDQLPSPRSGTSRILITSSGIIGAAFMWMFSLKLVAVLFGPAGIGIFSQFRQIVQSTGIAATFGGGASIIQGLSENTDPVYRKQFRSSIIRITLYFSLFFALSVLLCSSLIANYMFAQYSIEFIHAVQILSAGVLANALMMCFTSVINGYQLTGVLALSQFLAPFFIVVLLCFSPWLNRVHAPVLFAIFFVLSSLTGFLFSWFWIRKIISKDRSVAGESYLTRAATMSFLKFSSMTLMACLSGSLTLLAIRSIIFAKLGLTQAGLFDASLSLSFSQLTLFISACSIFYLPQLTQAKTPVLQARCIHRVSCIVIGSVTLISYCFFIFKTEFLTLLYSQEFIPARQSLCILSLGILIRSVSWAWGVYMIATKDFRALLISELLLNVLMLIFSFVTAGYGLSIEWVSSGIVLANLVTLIYVAAYLCRKNSLFKPKALLLLLGTALFPLGFVFFIEKLGVRFLTIDNPVTQAMLLSFIAVAICHRCVILYKGQFPYKDEIP